MAFRCGSGIAETTTTTGTGSYALGGAVTGYLAFSSALSVDDVTFYRCDNGAGTWEVGIGTRSGTSTLTRDTILKTSAGGTTAINWSSGTKTISCVQAGERAFAPDQINTFTAAQQFNGQEVRLNPLNDSYIKGHVTSSTEVVDLYVDNEHVARFSDGSLRILSDDAGASSGPVLALDRNSASPADDDVVGSLEFRGRDDGGTSTTYGRVLGEIVDVTDATEDGRLKLGVMTAGTMTNLLTLEPGTLFTPSASTLLVGKSATNTIATAGHELNGAGWSQHTRSANMVMALNRTGSIGTIEGFYYAGSLKGSIDVSTTATTYNTTSDRRWKRDIVPYGDGLSIILQLQPVEYGWVNEPGAPREVGLIAQDVQPILPQVAHGDPDGDEPMGIDYGRLTPLLISAVQTLAGKLDRLSMEVARLKSEASE